MEKLQSYIKLAFLKSKLGHFCHISNNIFHLLAVMYVGAGCHHIYS